MADGSPGRALLQAPENSCYARKRERAVRVLLVDPTDAVDAGAWTRERWDRIVDLGLSGETSYSRAAQQFGQPVTPLQAFRGEDFREIRRVRQLLLAGNGRLQDSTGLDWWELTAILVHQQLEAIVLLRKFVETLGPEDEVHVSRWCLAAEALGLQLGSRLHVFPSQKEGRRRGPGHYLQVLKKFPARQLLEIFWDKTDPGYQFRGPFTAKRESSSSPVVLLPTAYVNVSKTGIAYAKMLPEIRFLLLVTRPSGWVDDHPANVSKAWLRAYYSPERQVRAREYRDLMQRWQALRTELEETAEFEILSRLGYFDEFPVRFARGLEIRDAWRNVLDREPVQSLLCADDSNPYTHIPLLLAAHRKLPTVNCHHGALDGRYLFKSSHADVTLAKGGMEQDYLVRVCGLPEDHVEIGAPSAPPGPKNASGPSLRSAIVFFSEVYEVGGGRAREFYEDVLPRLADLALSEGKELIVKLHPSESKAERTQIVNRVLRPDQMQVVRIVDGGVTDDLWNQAWFGITVLSTVSVECALRCIPCFLCGWMEAWPYGYIEQFSRFGGGIRLGGAGEIEKIPAILKSYRRNLSIEKDLSTPIEDRRLRALLSVGRERAEAVGRQTQVTGCP
jgi:hypothetical protein